MDAGNPYLTPAAPRVDDRPHDPLRRRLAMLSWQLPLFGLALALLGYLFDDTVPQIGAMGFLVFLLSVGAGLVLALISLPRSRQYRGIFLPALVGLVATSLLVLTFLTMTAIVLFSVHQSRQRRHYIRLNPQPTKRAPNPSPTLQLAP